MISDLLFSHIKSAALGQNTTIGVFGGSLDAVVVIVDEMESNPDEFIDPSNTE